MQATPDKPPRAASSTTGHLLLAVEDELLADALARLLAAHYRVSLPQQRGQLLHQSSQLQPDLIVLDDTDREAEVSALCQHLARRLPDCALLYLSSDWQPSLAAQLRAHGVDAVLRKPFDTDALLRTIRQLLRRARPC